MTEKEYDPDDKMAEKKLRSSDYDEKTYARIIKNLNVAVGQDGKIRSNNARFYGTHRTE